MTRPCGPALTRCTGAELHAARRFLEYLIARQDPILNALMEAPDDDEPETEEERAAADQAYEDIKQGQIAVLDAVRRFAGTGQGDVIRLRACDREWRLRAGVGARHRGQGY